MSELVLVSEMDCGNGEAAPTPAENGWRLAGVSTSCAVDETNIVTSTVRGLPTAAAPVAGMVALIVMVPLQTPGLRGPVATLVETVRVSSVTPVNELLALAACSRSEEHTSE